MHVSRSEDKGGNAIQVRFEDKGTNLHSLWDSKLIERQGLDYKSLAAKLEKDNVRNSVSDISPIKWLYESYQISSELYAEIDKSGAVLPANYYDVHIPTVNKRLDIGGLRLAALLNKLFEAPVYNVSFPPNRANEVENVTEPQKIDINYIGDFIGQNVQISGKVFNIKKYPSMFLVDIGGSYPKQKIVVVIKGDAMSVANGIIGKMITVTGVLQNSKGKPEIIIKDKPNIVISK